MTVPASDYRATQIVVPAKLHGGLDRVVHAAVGRSRNGAAILRGMQAEAEQIVENGYAFRTLADGVLRARLQETASAFRRQRKGSEDTYPEALALLSEAAERSLGLRPYPVQILGALALARGYLAEMATGEGKTLTACLPAIVAGWSGRPCHIITANDYLAGRDAEEMTPLYSYCGVSTGWVSAPMTPHERRSNYGRAVVYTTSKELLADFLRDRLQLGLRPEPSRRQIRQLMPFRTPGGDARVLRGIDTAIVDEADSVLIDEAVTPLIISHPQPNEHLLEACRTAHQIARRLTAPADYCVEQKYREITLTRSGREKIEASAQSLPGLWQGAGRREELIIQALTAEAFYQRDSQYVVNDGRVVIVDEFTGRLMPDRTWQHGLHQAVEAREGLELSDPNETLARLSFQKFFRFFRKLSGMTGTAREAASEFWHIYGLPILTIPTHRPCIREQQHDRIYPNQEGKWRAIAEAVMRCHETGRPVLVGTRNVAASERLSKMLADHGLSFRLLNAVRHQEEAAIVAGAGIRGSITIATNMAGRGTDIKLGPGVAAIGGLHVIATERHESGRIDRQLFGRSGRQGDPGSACAYVSLEDELFERFLPGPVRRWLAAPFRKRVHRLQPIAERLRVHAQRAAQRLAFRQRQSVLEMDTWLAEALSFTGSSVEQ